MEISMARTQTRSNKRCWREKVDVDPTALLRWNNMRYPFSLDDPNWRMGAAGRSNAAPQHMTSADEHGTERQANSEAD